MKTCDGLVSTAEAPSIAMKMPKTGSIETSSELASADYARRWAWTQFRRMIEETVMMDSYAVPEMQQSPDSARL